MKARHPSWSARCNDGLVWTRRTAGAAAVVLLLSGCAANDPAAAPEVTTSTTTPDSTTSTAETQQPTPSPWPSPLTDTHQAWSIQILERRPHDAAAFTQGLEVVDGVVIEGTGRRGSSTVRRVGLDGVVLASADLDPEYFGEGLTVVGELLIQLTWQAGVALRWDLATLEPVGRTTYDGEGWGLCAADDTLWMSNGTATLTERDPTDFSVRSEVEVRRDDVAIANLNELECIDGYVVANVWHSDEILVIDPTTGFVAATIDASALRTEINPTDAQAVLNGIADLGDGTLLLGGKLWPTFFVVELV
ncbi:MAG: glutamine cyclotransferase [Candidatus Aldehydirespiratoraceae bacterium]|jgi:glutamine cyclotransferase